MKKELKEWVAQDDACDILEDGTIISYHCTDSGKDELELIISRLQSLYSSGGAVEYIKIQPTTKGKNNETMGNHR